VAEWLKAADCKSARFSVRWFESSPVHHLFSSTTCFFLKIGSDRARRPHLSQLLGEVTATAAATMREIKRMKFFLFSKPETYADDIVGRAGIFAQRAGVIGAVTDTPALLYADVGRDFPDNLVT
jgi:hypothetical protein